MLPLSSTNYTETWRQGSRTRRGELSAEMAMLSKFHALAPAWRLWDGEVDRALREVFGRPDRPRPLEVLGFGAAHVLGMPAEMHPDTAVLTPEQIFLTAWSILAKLASNER